jgi:hypothetical protein
MRLLKPLRVEASRVVDSKNHNVTLNRRDGRQACQLRSRPIACGQVPREWLFPDRGGRWGVGFRRLALPTNDSAVWGNGLVRPPLALEPSHLSPPHHGRANPGSVRQHMGQAGTAIGRPDGQVKEISGMNWPVSGDMGCSPRVRTHPCAHPLNISTAAQLSASFPLLRPENVV